MRWPADTALRRINNLLVAGILGLNLYLLLAPAWPQANYQIRTRISRSVSRAVADYPNLNRDRNRLLIPALELDAQIVEGGNSGVLREGIWRRPNTARPGSGSNTVLAGHRFTYAGASFFYHLDRLTIGDTVLLVYDHRIYRYQVKSSQVVSPDATVVEAPTTEERLTLYTCTPLWQPTNRLVYTASLLEVLP